ncbi:MAG: cytochrome c oxidase subunit II [Oligoflexus sp.]
MKHATRWLNASLLFLLSLTLSACLDSPMSTIDTVTEWGREINSLYLLTTIITGIVFVAVAVPFCYALWRFRERPDDDDRLPEQIRGNHKLEILWTIIPVVLLVFIFLPTFELILKQYEEPPKEAMRIRAIGYQWWWKFEYPDLGITTANELFVPENTPVVIELTSNDVIHSFWIPRWGGKVDNLPGETNLIQYTTPKLENPEGDYYWGHCAELCGLSHARMRFQAVVLSQERFDSWRETFNEPPLVASALEKHGQELFMTKTCFTCHAIEGTNAQGQIGPSLTNFGNRRLLAAGTLANDYKGMHQWLRDSVDSAPGKQKIKPGSLMVFAPGFELTDEEIEALVAYLHRSTAKTY